jgi:predicted Zn-dependent peptidase
LARIASLAVNGSKDGAGFVTAVAAGNFDWDKLVDLIATACGQWEMGDAPRPDRRLAPSPRATNLINKDKVAQEHVILMSPAPAADDPLRHSADTLALALGDDTGSRLYWALVDPGRVEGADMSYSEYDGTGAFYLSFSGEPDATTENLAITRELLADVQKNGLTEEELRQAKTKIGSRVVRASERPMGRMQAVGMAWNYLKQYRSVDDELKAFDAVSLASIREVLERHSLDQFTTLALGPLKEIK